MYVYIYICTCVCVCDNWIQLVNRQNFDVHAVWRYNKDKEQQVWSTWPRKRAQLLAWPRVWATSWLLGKVCWRSGSLATTVFFFFFSEHFAGNYPWFLSCIWNRTDTGRVLQHSVVACAQCAFCFSFQRWTIPSVISFRLMHFSSFVELPTSRGLTMQSDQKDVDARWTMMNHCQAARPGRGDKGTATFLDLVPSSTAWWPRRGSYQLPTFKVVVWQRVT